VDPVITQPDSTSIVGYNPSATADSSAALLGMDTNEYREQMVLAATGQTIQENVDQRTGETLNDVVVNQSIDEAGNALYDLSGPERSYKTQNILKQEGIFGKKDKHKYAEKLEKDPYFVKDFERFVPKDLLFLALESLKADKMKEGETAPLSKQKQVANDFRALQNQIKYYKGTQKSRPKNDQTGEIIEELFDESLYYFGQEFESVEAMLTALLSKNIL
jgi:hypothetical protein